MDREIQVGCRGSGKMREILLLMGQAMHYKQFDDPIKSVPSQRSRRTPEQVAELKFLAQEKRDRKAAKRVQS